jgi:hypothetical protein
MAFFLRFFPSQTLPNFIANLIRMDLRVSNLDKAPTQKDKGPDRRNARRPDRLNSLTGPLSCRLLEWIGWYNNSVSQRLLGHYRLFQLFKAHYPATESNLPVVNAYILQYRGSHAVKYFFSRIGAFLNTIVMRGETDRYVEIQGVNRLLLNERFHILHDFLVDAQQDFEAALEHALQHIRDPRFFTSGRSEIAFHQHNTYNNTSLSRNDFHVHPVIKEKVIEKEPVIIKEGTKGKEKGVFSKKQILILFDLLSQTAKIEQIDLHKVNKFDAVAQLMQALTSKAKESWLAELNDYRNKDLYGYHTQGELNQLLATLSNLAELFRNAGLRSVAGLADKKINELERSRF